MRASSKLLVTLVSLLVLTGARPAWGFGPFPVRDYRIRVGHYEVGFVDMNPGWYSPMDDNLPQYTLLDAGPLGRTRVPFSAATGNWLALSAAVVLAACAWLAWRLSRRWMHRRRRRIGETRRGFEVRAAAH